jgi:tetratricopeptide (TPR) repeat protein
MRSCHCLLRTGFALGVFIACGATALAVDTLTKTAPGDGEPVRMSGAIEAIGPEEVQIKDGTGKVHTVSVAEIDSIRYDQEPKTMFLARNAALRGAYDESIRMFEEIKDEDITLPEAKVDKEFYVALSTAHLALTGEKKLDDAEKLLSGFVANTKNSSSYHILEASQKLGDLLSLMGKHAEAERAYDKLISSRAVGYKMAGSVAKGYSLIAQKKIPEAQRAFDSVQAMGSPDNAQDVQQRHAASLGKATCMALGGGNLPEAIKVIEDVIAKTQEEATLYAKAYNTLGNCYLSTQNDKEALLAYLRVDVLYNTIPTEHAEALLQLSKLWKKLGNLPNAQDRASDCLTRLKTRYPNSPQAKQAQ